jgi:hypothetical protein
MIDQSNLCVSAPHQGQNRIDGKSDPNLMLDGSSAHALANAP